MALYAASDLEILRLLGSRLRQARLRQNLSQEELSERSGVHRSTLSELERGAAATMQTWIQLLRALGQLEALEDFLPEIHESPLELAERRGRRRQRATGRRGRKTGD